jgi:PAS domain S-box-containing protein
LAAIILFHNLGAPALTIWFNWFASDALGSITAAPLIVGLVRATRDMPKTGELLEGTIALVGVAAASFITLGASSDYWFTIAPLGLILPILFWLGARCPPLFAAAGVFFVALVVVATTTFGIGRLGEPGVPLVDRVQVARTALLLVSLCGYILAALFAERRRTEAALRESNERLRLAVEGADLGIWSLDLISGRFENDVRDRRIHGHSLEAPPRTAAEARSFINPDDLELLDADVRASGRARSNYRVDYRLAPAAGSTPAFSERWVALEGTVLRDANGQPVRLLGVTRDITERKHLEEALQRNERKFRELLEALPAAIYVTDAAGYVTYCNQAAVDLWGRRPKFGEDKWSDLARFYDRNGIPMVPENRPTEIALKEGRLVRNVEGFLERLDGTRVPIVPYPTPLHDAAGAIVGVINMTLDISERKKAELALIERTMQLDLAGKIVLVGTFAYDVASGLMTISPGYAAIHGLPEGTEESSRADWRARIHPEDLSRLEARFGRALAARRREHNCDYRIVRPDGEVRWIQSRSVISYDSEAGPRLVGANIDVTDRKQAEQALEERNMQLALAGKAAGVGTFISDLEKGVAQVTEGYAALYGLPEGATEITRNEWRARLHPEDIARIEEARSQAYRERQSELSNEYRIVRPGGEVRWIESRSFLSYSNDGRPQRVIGLNIDVTDRKNAERTLADRNMQLSLAGKAAGVGSYAYDHDNDVMQVCEGYAALHGLPEGTTETTRAKWRARVHPDDLARVQERRKQAFRDKRAEYGIEYRIVRPGGEVRWIESRSFISYDADDQPQRVIGLNIDVTERRRADDHQRVLIAELDHRVKNVLATVAAVAANTLEASSSMQHFVAALDARIRALASTHELLSNRRWQGLPLDELLRCQLAPYAADGNTRIDGPDVLLMAEAGQAVAMVFHELVTNAAKYGALSGCKGLVSVQWRQQYKDGLCDRLIIDWQEAGGPAVKAPGKFGYGTSVINDLVPYELGGKAGFEFSRTGVRCRLEIPVKWIISPPQPGTGLNGANSAPTRVHETV